MAKFGVYAMTKFGVQGFTESLRQEVTQKHVRVGFLEPGAVATELVSQNNQAVQDELAASDAERIPETASARGHRREHRVHGHPPTPIVHRRTLGHAHLPGLSPPLPHELPVRRTTMKYRTLSGTGISVSNLALGTMGFGTETDDAAAFAILDRFVEADGNLVDTANVYGGGASEEVLGRWFAEPADVTDRVVLAKRPGSAPAPT